MRVKFRFEKKQTHIICNNKSAKKHRKFRNNFKMQIPDHVPDDNGKVDVPMTSQLTASAGDHELQLRGSEEVP